VSSSFGRADVGLVQVLAKRSILQLSGQLTAAQTPDRQALVQVRSRIKKSLESRRKACASPPPVQIQKDGANGARVSALRRRKAACRAGIARKWTQARQQLHTLYSARPPLTDLAPAGAGRGRYLRQEALFAPGLCAGSAEGGPGVEPDVERLLYRLTHSAGRAFRHARRAARPAGARSGAATGACAPAGRAR